MALPKPTIFSRILLAARLLQTSFHSEDAISEDLGPPNNQLSSWMAPAELLLPTLWHRNSANDTVVIGVHDLVAKEQHI